MADSSYEYVGAAASSGSALRPMYHGPARRSSVMLQTHAWTRLDALLEIRSRVQDKGAPYVVFVLQELERMNKILSAMRQQLNELAAKGGARGVKIASLERFCTAKGPGGTTLIECLATILDKKGQAHHLDFVDGIPSLVDAARYVDDDHTAGAARILRKRLAALRSSDTLNTIRCGTPASAAASSSGSGAV